MYIICNKYLNLILLVMMVLLLGTSLTGGCVDNNNTSKLGPPNLRKSQTNTNNSVNEQVPSEEEIARMKSIEQEVENLKVNFTKDSTELREEIVKIREQGGGKEDVDKFCLKKKKYFNDEIEKANERNALLKSNLKEIEEKLEEFYTEKEKKINELKKIKVSNQKDKGDENSQSEEIEENIVLKNETEGIDLQNKNMTEDKQKDIDDKNNDIDEQEDLNRQTLKKEIKDIEVKIEYLNQQKNALNNKIDKENDNVKEAEKNIKILKNNLKNMNQIEEVGGRLISVINDKSPTNDVINNHMRDNEENMDDK